MKWSHLILCLMVAAVSCSEPRSTETFILSDDARDGLYRFRMDLSDTTCTWALAFYTRIDGTPEVPAIPLTVTWLSPSLACYEETVYFDTGGGDQGWSRQLVETYREGVTVREPGQWSLTVKAPEEPWLRGLGLICQKTRTEDGTR